MAKKSTAKFCETRLHCITANEKYSSPGQHVTSISYVHPNMTQKHAQPIHTQHPQTTQTTPGLSIAEHWVINVLNRGDAERDGERKPELSVSAKAD